MPFGTVPEGWFYSIMEARARVEYMKNNPKAKGSLTPHDDFFKLQMEVKEKAVDLLQAALPDRLLAKLNLNTLKLTNNTFTDGQIGNFRADVVYECEFGENESVWITVLLEHKSYVEAFPHLQLLKYMWGVWDRESKQDHFIRPILPILFYHGEKEWTYRPFEEYFHGGKVDPDLYPFTPFFNYYFINLIHLGKDWIEDRIDSLNLKVPLRLMLNIRSPHLLEELEGIFEGIEEMLKTEEGRKNLKDIYVYLFKGSKISNDKIREAMDSITFLNNPSPVGSAAWQLEQKGEKRGEKRGEKIGKMKGKEEAKKEIAIKLLQKEMSIEFVIEVSGLTRAQVEQLQEEI